MALNRPKIVGITGGIGSGKTTVSQIFDFLGLPVYNSDSRAKFLMQTDAELRNKIIHLFGNEAYQLNGTLNNVHLGTIAFQNPELLEKLNQLVHPAVAKDFSNWISKNSDAPLIIKEAAILFESGSYKDCDEIILVTSPEALRIERVEKRSGLSPTEIKKRINKQWSDDQKRPLAHYIVENDSIKELIPQVLEVYQMIKKSII